MVGGVSGFAALVFSILPDLCIEKTSYHLEKHRQLKYPQLLRV